MIYSTLCKIIDDFFVLMGADCVLLYHCDHSDNKQAYRNKLFNHWYNCTPLSSAIERYSLEVSIAGDEIPMTYYLGYLTPKNNPNLPVLKAEFEDLAFYIIEPKQPNPTH